MPTTVAFVSADGHIGSANDGTTGVQSTGGNSYRIGREASDMRYVALLGWPTDLGIGTDVVSAATLDITPHVTYTPPPGGVTLEARTYQWATLTPSSWVPRASLSGLPLIAQSAISSSQANFNRLVFTDAGIGPAIQATRTAGQAFKILINLDRHRTETPAYTAPDSIEIRAVETGGTVYDPAVTLTHGPAGTTITGAGSAPTPTGVGSVDSLNSITGAGAAPAPAASGSITSPAPLADLGPAVGLLAEPTTAGIREATVWTEGDVEPDLRIQVVDSTRTRVPIDMTGRTGTIRVRRPDGTLIEGAATIEPGTAGWVSRQWQVDELTAGLHHVEFHDSTGQTIPAGSFYVRPAL